MSCSSEVETASSPSKDRLGVCEACNENEAKYTCPRCEVKTCGLTCLNLHKRELKCDGKRDRTKYIPLIKMTKMDMMNDYYFLEQCTKFVEDCKRDPTKRFTGHNRNLPNALFRLRQAAVDRGTELKFLLPNFSKRQKNTTLLDKASGLIMWRIEWCFPNGSELMTFVDENVSENSKICDIVDKYLQPSANNEIPGISKLSFWQARGIAGVQLLLKSEGIMKCRNRTFPLKPDETLRESLRGKTVVEFPTIYVVPREQVDQFDIVDSDDDLETESRQNKYFRSDSDISSQVGPRGPSTDYIEGQLNQMEINHKNKENPKCTEASKDKPKHLNFLFSDDFESDEAGELSEEEITDQA